VGGGLGSASEYATGASKVGRWRRVRNRDGGVKIQRPCPQRRCWRPDVARLFFPSDNAVRRAVRLRFPARRWSSAPADAAPRRALLEQKPPAALERLGTLSLYSIVFYVHMNELIMAEPALKRLKGEGEGPGPGEGEGQGEGAGEGPGPFRAPSSPRPRPLLCAIAIRAVSRYIVRAADPRFRRHARTVGRTAGNLTYSI
jgi:hypothetical protein